MESAKEMALKPDPQCEQNLERYQAKRPAVSEERPHQRWFQRNYGSEVSHPQQAEVRWVINKAVDSG